MKPLLKVISLYKNEEALLKGVLKNNRSAQRKLYELYAPKMLSVCRYYIKDLQHAEEVMLNGFFKVFQNVNKFKKEGSFEGWIRKIMMREAISYLRSQKKIEFVTENIEIENEYVNNIHSTMEVAQIQHCIDSLPDGYKIVFVMYAIEGYKHSEISKLLKISEGTSKSQLFKARKLLQKKVNELNKVGYVAKGI